MAERVRDHLGRFGVWRSGGMVTPELAIGLERLGYGTLWLGGSPGRRRPGGSSAADRFRRRRVAGYRDLAQALAF